MHIPDGILPVWLWVAGFLAMFTSLGISLFRLKGMDMKLKIPLLGALSAAMLVAMSLEIVPLAYHINLSVVTGILLGPSLGFIAAFIANFILALMGHGGITVMGLNTLILGAEAVLGHAFFTVLGRHIRLFWSAAAATVADAAFDNRASHRHRCRIELRSGVFYANQTVTDHGAHNGPISVGRFAALSLGLGALGWILEAAITGRCGAVHSQVKPDLLRHVLHGTGRNDQQEAP